MCQAVYLKEGPKNISGLGAWFVGLEYVEFEKSILSIIKAY